MGYWMNWRVCFIVVSTVAGGFVAAVKETGLDDRDG